MLLEEEHPIRCEGELHHILKSEQGPDRVINHRKGFRHGSVDRSHQRYDEHWQPQEGDDQHRSVHRFCEAVVPIL